MKRLIIDGNAVYEIDEQCMRKRKQEKEGKTKNVKNENNKNEKKYQE